MMLERETVADLFGLAGSFPRPGWVVLDAAREHRFTGELVFETVPEVRAYLDRGEIYLAERSTDASLGSRLIDGGALTTTQLEHGAMRVGDTEHLGRLFDRVPSVDRQYVLLMTELMNEECVSWVARQQVQRATSTPYAHHASGIHRWDRPTDAVDLRPGDPLPAPALTDAPVEFTPPEPVFFEFSSDTDPLIRWDEPSWLDERPTAVTPIEAAEIAPLAPPAPLAPVAPLVPLAPPIPVAEPAAPRLESLLESDWADRLESEGLPELGRDPLAVPTPLPAMHVDNQERFELIWPSGEIDENFGAVSALDSEDDRDRVGPTARVVRSVTIPSEPDPGPDAESATWWDFETTGPSFGPPDAATGGFEPEPLTERVPETIAGLSLGTRETGVEDGPSLTDVSDDVVLSVRRAVASIETGSLAARRRLADNPIDEDSSRGIDPVPPGRVATRSEYSVWSVPGSDVATAGSVFDEIASAAPDVSIEPPDVAAVAAVAAEPSEAEAPRVSALRRLIGGLRRR